MQIGTPSTFLWGASTASYQVEGGITNNDWHYFITSKPIRNRICALRSCPDPMELKPAGEAGKVWNPKYYKNDFALAKKLGLNIFRISLEWSRIEPERGRWDQEALFHYREMLTSIQMSGLRPIVTLNHLTLPLWVLIPPSKFARKLDQYLMTAIPSSLRDMPLAHPLPEDPFWNSLMGWENYETVSKYIEFVSYVVKELGDVVDYWVTISEPVAAVIYLGYITGLCPPGFMFDGDRAKNALHNLILANILTYDKITQLDKFDADGDGISKYIGVSHMMMQVSPAKQSDSTYIPSSTANLFKKRNINNDGNKNSKDNVEAASNFAYFINDYFINAVVNGEEDLNYLETLQRYDRDSPNFTVHQDWINKTDFIGIDYYRRVYIQYDDAIASSPVKFVGGVLIDRNDEKSPQHLDQPSGMSNDLGWEIYPPGLYNLVIHMNEEMGL